ncbi:hypothetical protein OSB04_027956 [Centaurea solstitialis]|uniref:eRF1/Pelota-like N-terminal domain-containing protein n=1 Tax=Centaurea solstitialis TaxID=347529 RepID=A0AA38SSA3_9ASTR|nr:hypothetical protein OSB04_027956 [Centaurea solstitialis]
MTPQIGRKKRSHHRRTRSVNRAFVTPTAAKPSLSDQASRTTSEVELIPNVASDSIRALADAAAMMTTAEGSRSKGKEVLAMDVDHQPPPQPRPTFDLNHTPDELSGTSHGNPVTLEALIDNANRTLAISLANSQVVPPPLALGQLQHTPRHPFSVVNPYITASTDPTVMMLNAYGVPVPYVPPPTTFDRPNPYYAPPHVSVPPPTTISVARATVVPMTTTPQLNPIPPIRHVYIRRSSTARNPTPPAPNPISWAPPSVPRSSHDAQASRQAREEVRLLTLLSNETAFLRFNIYHSKIAHSPKGFLEDTVSRLSNIKKVITTHGWDILCAVPNQYNLSWVREFYTEASIRNSQQIPVRGILVDYSPASIHTLLGTRPHSNSRLEALRKHLSKDDLDDILLTLTIPGSDWYFEGQVRHLRIKSLTAEANVWAQFVKHTLFPTSHNSKQSIDRVLILYCILKGHPFDVGALISTNIKTSCIRINCRLFYPTIIHGLMAKANVWIFPTDIFPKEKMVLGRKVLGKLLRSCPSKTGTISPQCEPLPNSYITTPKDPAQTEQFLSNPHFKMQDIRELFRMHHNHQRTLSWISRVLFEFRAYDVHRDRIWRDTVRVLNRDLLYGLPSYPTLPPLKPMLHPLLTASRPWGPVCAPAALRRVWEYLTRPDPGPSLSTPGIPAPFLWGFPDPVRVGQSLFFLPPKYRRTKTTFADSLSQHVAVDTLAEAAFSHNEQYFHVWTKIMLSGSFLTGTTVHHPTMADAHDTDKNIEIWKIKKLIKALEAARGNGTSMISLIMPPRDQVSRVTKMLGDEFGTASNIKSRVNRQSVLGAITSAQQRLKLYNKVPPNGLVLYTGTIVTDDGKEKKVTIDFEPFRPINASLYLCDNKFHTEALNELLESDEKFGFIVMDGNGTLFGTLSGNTREVLHKFSVDLPKKHGRGGQSALRFARLRMEKRHNYVRKTAELATQFFINPATSQPNVSGLILAGSADFKTELSQSDMFDPRLQAKILNIVDVSYGGENGFNQAIELSAEILANVKFIQEKRLIGKYFEEISQDTGKYVFGVDDTMKALEMGAVETLIVWENLDINRDPTTNAELEAQDKISLLEWFANEYRKFGCTLQFVTNRSQEGSQFCRGFGGIGGILRYQLDMRAFDELSDDDIYEDSE